MPLLSRPPSHRFARFALAALAAALVPSAEEALAGTWTKISQSAPAPINLMLLLSDGTVMCARNDFSGVGSKVWYRLTPDHHGSYTGGTWSALASAHDMRQFGASQVLRDGRVFVAGGEYGTGVSTAEVYDPRTDAWTQINPPASLWNPAVDSFLDSISEILQDGRVLVMPWGPHSASIPLLYDPVINVWSNAGAILHGTNQVEATWVKLPDGSILTIDSLSVLSERYIPSLNAWVDEGTVPVTMYDPIAHEIGGAVLLPNGAAFFLGATGHTALYAPSGTTSPGQWTAGPNLPANKSTPDAPLAMLVTGNALCAVSGKPTGSNPFPLPTTFYEYDPVANSFALQPGPSGPGDLIPTFQAAMLVLPDGGVLYSHGGVDLYEYKPSGAALAAGKPVITSMGLSADGTYHLVGTGLNGINEGAAYGDDLQMNSNYPLVRLTSGANSYYARTHDWSSTGVKTGATLAVSTEFDLPNGLPAGSYSLEVVANGIASDSIPFTTPICQTSLGFGGPGSAVLSICGGDLSAGTSADLFVTRAPPNQFALLVASAQHSPTPFLGGMVVPYPVATQFALSTGADGNVHVPGILGGGGPISLYAQLIYIDPTRIDGVGISNAVRLDVLP